MLMKKYIQLLRVHHYIKNLLVFSAIIFGSQLFSLDKLGSVIIAFFSFCFSSSFVYIFNDIRDADKDRNHPQKRNRPIAANKISVKRAVIIACICLLISCILMLLSFNLTALLLWAAYIILNILYSIGLKNYPLVDVCILVSGFLIRIMYGAVVSDIAISDWLYLTVISLSFFFALGKRRNEYKQIGNTDTRRSLSGYTWGFLDKSMYMCLTLANVFYALWSVGESTISRYHGNRIVFSVPIVLLISLKYSHNIEKDDSDGDPVEVLLHDRTLIILCLVYIMIMMCILYSEKIIPGIQ